MGSPRFPSVAHEIKILREPKICYMHSATQCLMRRVGHISSSPCIAKTASSRVLNASYRRTYISLVTSLLCLPILSIVSVTHASSEGDTGLASAAREVWLTGYNSLEKARTAEKDGNQAAAARFYQEALTTFKKVQQQYPDWQPSLIRYRIEFCRKRIEAVRDAAATSRRELPRADLLDLLEKTKSQLYDVETKNRELTKQLRSAADELKHARAEAARNAEAADRVSELAQQTSQLASKLKNKSQIIQTLQQRNQALADNKTTSGKLDKLENKLQLSQVEKAKLQQRISEINKQYQKLQRTLKKLRHEKNQLQITNRKLSQRAEANRSHAAEMAQEIKNIQSAFQSRTQEWQSQREDYKNQIKRLRNLSSRAVSQLEAANRRIEQLESTTADEEGQNDTVKTRRKVVEQLKQLSAEVTDKQKIAQEQEEIIAELQKQVASRNETLNRQNLELTAARQKANRLAQMVKILKQREDKLESALHAASQETDESGGALTQLQEISEEQREKVDALTAANRQLNQKNRTQKLLLREQEQQIKQLQAQLKDHSNTTQTDPDTEQGTGAKRGSDQLRFAQQKLKQLRARVAELQEKLGTDTPPTKHTGKEQTAVTKANGSSDQGKKNKTKQINSLLRRGIEAERKKSFQTAAHYYNELLQINADHKMALQRLGNVELRHNNYEQAANRLKKAFKQDPDDLDTLLPLGHALVQTGDVDLAVSMLSRAVALEPNNHVLHRTLGVACSSLGWRDAAATQFHRALKIEPEDSESAFNLALLYATGKNPRVKDARKWYRRAIEFGAERDPGLEEALGLPDNAEKTPP